MMVGWAKGYGQAWVRHSMGLHKPTAVYERGTHRIRRGGKIKNNTLATASGLASPTSDHLAAQAADAQQSSG